MRFHFLLSILFLSLSLISYSQKLEISAGGLKNHFHNGIGGTDGGHIQTDYVSGNGGGVYLAIDSIRYEFMVYRFTLGFEQYQGGFWLRSGGQMSSIVNEGFVTKSKIMLGFYPGNFRLKNWDINLGIEFGFLVHQENIGTTHSVTYDFQSIEVSETDISDDFNNNFSFDLKLRIAYDFYLQHNLAISPIFAINYGLASEFNTSNHSTKSVRFFLGFGVERTLGKKSTNDN